MEGRQVLRYYCMIRGKRKKMLLRGSGDLKAAQNNVMNQTTCCRSTKIDRNLE